MSEKPITIGTSEAGPIHVDLDVLINTRLLIQANSGAGKSWCLRRLLERTHGRLQHLVIDPEGEFASLRERFDYVLAAKREGDTLADPRSAALLAERLLELGVSAILDIYELAPHDRVRFVRTFVEALVDAPKALWHPVLVVLDEAHVYAPENGDAESAEAVKGLATRGRKRGFCLVAATQRLSKLHKDVAAECNNKLIGRSSLDVDMKRAGAELGFTSAAAQLALRDLEKGEFFAFGPALTRVVTKVKVGDVATRHPEAGARLAAVVPPPTEKVKSVLAKLADLPQEAERKAATEADLRKQVADRDQRIRALERQVATASNVESQAAAAPALTDADREVLRALGVDFREFVDAIAVRADAVLTAMAARAKAAIDESAARWIADVDKRRALFIEHLEKTQLQTVIDKLNSVTPPRALARPTVSAHGRPPQQPAPPSPRARPNRAVNGSGEPMAGGERKILSALAQYPAGRTKRQVALLTGYAINGGGFNNYLGSLRAKGWITTGEPIRLTDAGEDALGPFDPLPSGDDLREHWRRQLGKAEGLIFAALVQAYPDAMSKDEVAEAAGYEATGGGFNNALGRLRTLELINGRGELRVSDELFS